MSAVRLDPVIKHKYEFLMAAPLSFRRAKAVSRSGTNCPAFATTM